MARRRRSVIPMIAALLAVAAAVWAVSLRTRPAFAVYDSLPAPSGGGPAASAGAPAAVTPRPGPAGDTAAAAFHPPMPAPGPAAIRSGNARRAPAMGDTAGADTAGADTGATADTVRHHRSENYGGYSGYGSRERRGNPNAR